MLASPALPSDRLCLRPFDPSTAPPRLRLEANLRRQGSSLFIRWILSGDLEPLRLPEPVQAPRRLNELWTSTCLECFLARPGDEGYWELNLSPSGDWNLYRLDGYRQGLRPEAAIQALPSRLRRSDIRDSDGIGESDGVGVGIGVGIGVGVGVGVGVRADNDDCQDGRVGGDQDLALGSGLTSELTSGVKSERVLELSVELDLEALLGAEARGGVLELGVTAVLEQQDGLLSYWALSHPAAEADFHHRGGFVVRLPG